MALTGLQFRNSSRRWRSTTPRPTTSTATPRPQVNATAARARTAKSLSLASIEEAITRVSQHVSLSPATPTDVAGQPAYTVTASPREAGGLLASAQLSFDASNGVPLRAAVYATNSSAPVLELAASEVSFGPVASSVFELQPPAGVKVHELKAATASHTPKHTTRAQEPKVTVHGHGPSAIVVLESRVWPLPSARY